MAFLVLSVYSIHTACQELTMDVQYEYVFWLSFFGIVFGVVFLPITNFTTHIKFSKLILGTCTLYMYVWNMYSFGVQHQVHVLSTLHVTGFQTFNWTMQLNGFITFNAGSFVCNAIWTSTEQCLSCKLYWATGSCTATVHVFPWQQWRPAFQLENANGNSPVPLYGWDFIVKVLSRS